jgi:flagellar biosynthesis protein FlhF
MSVKRFFGESAREALRKVKEVLGAEAIVISNKSVPGGVEIMAMSADSLEALQGAAGKAKPAVPDMVAAVPPAPTFGAPAGRPNFPPAPTFQAEEEASDYSVTLSAKARAPSPFQSWQPWLPPRQESEPTPAIPAVRPAEEKVKLRPLPPKTPHASSLPGREQVAAALAQAAQDELPAGMIGGMDKGSEVQELVAEMRTIKSLLERQLAGFAWGDMTRHAPAKAQLLGEMIDAGFSGQLARRLVEDMPADLEVQAGRKWLTGAVNRRLRTLSSENDLIERGGVFALVGPTGVGKTTTTAKLAARCVVRYGAEKLALLTTDGYRIGAHEQLRIYGRILGVPVHVVRDSEDLRRTLADLRGKHMVLIDTVGMSQRDRMVAEQAAMLMRAGDVKRLLLLNATSRGDTLDDVIRSYAGEDIAGCILSKVDETAALAPALDAVVRHGLLLAYVANGQRVPEDLHLPNRNYLLHRAFKQPAAGSVHRLREEEVGLVMPAQSMSAAQGAALV